MFRPQATLFVFTLTGAAAAPLPSGGPALLGYQGSVLPTGVCRALRCQNVGSFPVITGYKGYVYKTDGGTLTVYRDAGGAIRGGNLWAGDTKLPAPQAIAKFIKAFAGANWSPALQARCSENLVFTGRTVGKYPFGITCTPNEAGVVIEVFDTRLGPDALKAISDSEELFF